MPPTPPANSSRARMVLLEQQRRDNNDSPTLGSKHRISDAPQLRPTPLKLRKKKFVASNRPPTTLSPIFGPDPVPNIVQEKEDDTLPPQPATGPTPEKSVPFPAASLSLPSVSPSPEPVSPFTHFPDVEDQDSNKATSECSSPVKSTCSRTSQWLDGDGKIDRKKLSMYLSGVLDPSFEIIGESLNQSLLPPDYPKSPLREHDGARGNKSWRFSHVFNDTRHSYRPASAHVDTPPIPKTYCRCPAGVVICQCYSSQEFEHFRRGQDHKANPSVSSTTCFLSVPRARFRSTLGDLEEADTPSSPPALMYDSDESEEFDWSLPNSPTFDERRLQYQQTPTPLPRQSSMWRPPVPSFSLPFSNGKQIRPRFYQDRNSALPGEEQTSPSSTIPTLASISTVSTFTFDFGGQDDETEYDPFDDISQPGEIKTWEPIRKAKPTLVHCRGPSPQSIKYGYDNRSKTPSGGAYSSTQDGRYGTIYV
ncbi:uncharacterized protein Z518_09270 [Rhinocladiella mackenziei CBS 650.93]|uniref:Uncharacterized protein n=1 Tax=Rhinocladiella mackenziei CBS 650.93 TaxID=1442369 RepID=A0A0D2I6W3_9EURO|nr:uncharacterized protein Z518_09270 [Rhinocladiella mackenziei CBS 650.93]KIX01544.1 hypothetical protein Z518_09270 [Rhinocladiella mackenziei CBS 650.93]